MKAFKIFGAIYFGLCTIGGIVATLSLPTTDGLKLICAVIATVCGVLTYLLIRSIHKSAKQSPIEQASTIVLDTPEDILRDMKKHYSLMQAQQDYQIMRDSFDILQKTTSFEVFESRYEMMYRKAYTLIQARQAGCKGVDKFASGAEIIIPQLENIRTLFLYNTYEKEIASAQQLKTPSGRNKRLTKFLEQLQEHEIEFATSDAYEEIVEKVKALITT